MEAEANSAASQGSSEGASTAIEGGKQDLTPYLEHTRKELSDTKKEVQNLKGVAATVERMREVFAPQAQTQAEGEDLEKFLETYLDAGLEAEKSGKPMPLTTNLAVKLYESMKEQKKLMAELEKLKGRAANDDNPVTELNRRAYSEIDDKLLDHLYGTYGRENVSDELYSSVASEITKEIKRLHVEEPATWEEIRRSSRYKDNMVKHFANKYIPQGARTLMRQQEVQNTEMTQPMLMQALKEAREIKDSVVREKLVTKIRQEILSQQFVKQKNRNRS